MEDGILEAKGWVEGVASTPLFTSRADYDL